MSDTDNNDKDPAVKLTSVVVNTLSNNHDCCKSTCFTDEAMACQSSVLFTDFPIPWSSNRGPNAMLPWVNLDFSGFNIVGYIRAQVSTKTFLPIMSLIFGICFSLHQFGWHRKPTGPLESRDCVACFSFQRIIESAVFSSRINRTCCQHAFFLMWQKLNTQENYCFPDAPIFGKSHQAEHLALPPCLPGGVKPAGPNSKPPTAASTLQIFGCFSSCKLSPEQRILGKKAFKLNLEQTLSSWSPAKISYDCWIFLSGQHSGWELVYRFGKWDL